MKKQLLTVFLLSLIVLFSISSVVTAQSPPHPPQTGHGIKGNQSPGGTARVGDGLSILLAFALAYGYRKIKSRKTTKKLISKQE